MSRGQHLLRAGLLPQNMAEETTRPECDRTPRGPLSIQSHHNIPSSASHFSFIFSTSSKECQHVTLGSEFPTRELSEDKVKLECVHSEAS